MKDQTKLDVTTLAEWQARRKNSRVRSLQKGRKRRSPANPTVFKSSNEATPYIAISETEQIRVRRTKTMIKSPD